MANKQFGVDYGAASALTGTETLSIVQSSVTVDATTQQLADLPGGFGTGLDADANGYRGIPQNSQSGNYTCVAADAGKGVFHPSGAGAGDTFTIPANASVSYELGTALTFINMDSNALSIAITSDTMNLAGAGRRHWYTCSVRYCYSCEITSTVGLSPA